LATVGSIAVSWSSDHFRERRLHTVLPIATGAFAVAAIPATQGNLTLTVICLMVAYFGFKAYIPIFWTLPSLLLTEAAAAGSIGLINSIGNLGGFWGPVILGEVKTLTGSFVGGLYWLSASMFLSATLLFFLGLGKRPVPATVPVE
jgi:ACS family tartrate transporter-like MFS transporter